MPQLPILMYHNVCDKNVRGKGLTIAQPVLESHFKWLKEQGYVSLHFADLKQLSQLPKKAVIITFDDVCVNQLEYAYPLLQEYGLKATFFAPFSFIGQSDAWNEGKEPLMSVAQLKSLDSAIVELGHHSFQHRRYASLSVEEIKTDLEQSFHFINEHDLTVFPALAYPYGNFPRKQPENDNFKTILRDHGIEYGLRIGNKRNAYPFNDVYEIKRIDVKGEDHLRRFRLKMRFGKLRLF